MSKVVGYHRPASLEAALELLSDPRRIPLAGGTVVNTPGGEPVEVVDLQALGLTGISDDGDIRIGATTTLQDIVDSDVVPPLIREAARRELPSTLRNQATIGGTVASTDGDSVLIAALMVHAAAVETVADDGSLDPIDAYLDRRPRRLITAVKIEGGGEGTIVATGRTPADVPIVAAVARRDDAGLFVALTGVADTPVLVDPEAPTRGLDPAGDFRGSADYRRRLADLNTRRAVRAVS